MSDNDNTKCLDIASGDASSTGAANRNNEKPKPRSRSKEVSEIMRKSEDINKAQQAPPSRKTAERRMKKETPKKASTSTRKRRKTSSEKSQGCTSSSTVAKSTTSSSSRQAKVTALDKNKIQEKPKRKINKKEVNKNNKHKQGDAVPTYQPQQFIGLYVCKERNGTKSLGSVISYDAKTKLFEIGYDNDETEHMEQDEVLKSKANAKDIFEARQLLQSSNNNSKKITDEEKQKVALSEEE